jgi:hypothetical protein
MMVTIRRFRNGFEIGNAGLIVNGSTYALSNQWGRYDLPALDKLIARYSEAGISYTKALEEP